MSAAKIQYLETASFGLHWMRRYYRENPQLDRKSAVTALKAAEHTLAAFPESGEKFDDVEGVREYHIHGTPFSLLYTYTKGTVWIIDLRDQRGNRSAQALRAFIANIRKKNQL